MPSSITRRLGALENALKSDLLTPKLWNELWEIYRRQCSVEFLFLHKETFLEPLVLPSTKDHTTQGRGAHDSALVLAFLTQTSRLHAELVAQTGNPYDTAEFYAAAALKHLDRSWSSQGKSAMQQTQALLMLGYHAWGADRSIHGYMMIEQAIAFAGVEICAYNENADKRSLLDDSASRRDRFIQQESKRRTYWSCFILDRILSVEKRRPRVIQAENLRALQVPRSNENFTFGRPVKTRLFEETDQEYGKRRKETHTEAMQRNDGHGSAQMEWEDWDDDGAFGRYFIALEHFVDVKELLNRGRRYARAPSATMEIPIARCGRSERPKMGSRGQEITHHQLYKRLRAIKEELPDKLMNMGKPVFETPSTIPRIHHLIYVLTQRSTAYLDTDLGLQKLQGTIDTLLVTELVLEGQMHYRDTGL